MCKILRKLLRIFIRSFWALIRCILIRQKLLRVRQLVYVSIFAKKLAMLEKEVTAEEIRTTLFYMEANKAPGPNGFSSDFFKSS
jgi:hypothetical protein